MAIMAEVQSHGDHGGIRGTVGRLMDSGVALQAGQLRRSWCALHCYHGGPGHGLACNPGEVSGL